MRPLLSRRGLDTIEEDLAGPKAWLNLPQALGRSHKGFLQCVGNMLCPKCVVSECRYVVMLICHNVDKSRYVKSCDDI